MAGPARTGSDAGSFRHSEYSFKPPRPKNSWILYREHSCKLIAETHRGMPQSDVSKLISEQWRNESEEVRRVWEKKAEEEKQKHAQKYPGYRYAPTPKDVKAKQKQEEKKARRAKKSKPRDATLADTNADTDSSAGHTALAPPLPPLPFVATGYPNMMMQGPCMISYVPAARQGSRPLVTTTSLASLESTESSEDGLVSSSSSPSVQSPSTLESQASFTSAQPPTPYLPSLPSHQLSPTPYPTQQFLVPASQPTTAGALPPSQYPSIGHTVWNDTSVGLPEFHAESDQRRVNLTIPIDGSLNFPDFQQRFPGLSSDSLQEQLSTLNINHAFSLSNIQCNGLVAHPQGDFDIVTGYQAQGTEYNDGLFNDVDFTGSQHELAFLTQGGFDPAPATLSYYNGPEDPQSLFRTSDNVDVQPYTVPQDMMGYVNLEDTEGFAEDASSIATSAPLPATISPHQLHLQNAHNDGPILSPMTNTPAAPSRSSYVPPRGATQSFLRRVAASWKVLPVFTRQQEEFVEDWITSTK